MTTLYCACCWPVTLGDVHFSHRLTVKSVLSAKGFKSNVKREGTKTSCLLSCRIKFCNFAAVTLK